ncbi:MAG: site-specific integrase [archaeon]|jgi:site-specific recombinase XerD
MVMMSNENNWNFHGYERRLQIVLTRMNPAKYGFERLRKGKCKPPFELTPRNIELLEKFYVDIVNSGITKSRIVCLIDQICRMFVWLGKDWDNASIDDVKQIVNRIRNADFTEHTKSDYLCKLKQFDKWFCNGEYSEKTRWIKTTMKSRCYKLPNQLITPEEAQLLIDSTRSARDRAVVHLLWETGARVGEIANLKIGDLAFSQGECQVNLYGKTGSRRVLLLESVRDLQNHIKTRQAKSPDDFVFLLNGTTNNGYPITYSSIKKILYSAIKDTKLPKKIYPHLFRHSRASYLASKGLSEAQLCSIFGWVLGSKQVRTYIHLSLQQVQDAYKQIYGIKRVEETKNDLIKCQVCDEMNPASHDTCQNCYNPLTIQGALRIKKEKEIIQQDRDTLQKIYAEAFRIATTKKLSLEEAQVEAAKTIAQREVEKKSIAISASV